MASNPFLKGKGYCISSLTISVWVNRAATTAIYTDPNGVFETKHEHDSRMKRENAVRKAPERQRTNFMQHLDRSYDMIADGQRPKDHKFKTYDENMPYDTASAQLQALYDLYHTPIKSLDKLQKACNAWRKITDVHAPCEQLEHYMTTQKVKPVKQTRTRKRKANDKPLPTPDMDEDTNNTFVPIPKKKIKTET